LFTVFLAGAVFAVGVALVGTSTAALVVLVAAVWCTAS
jgi:hypothetical protein